MPAERRTSERIEQALERLATEANVGMATASVDGRPHMVPLSLAWLVDLGEFALPYKAVATADDPDATLVSFFDTTHAAAAELAHWDREELECAHPEGPDWWLDRPHHNS